MKGEFVKCIVVPVMDPHSFRCGGKARTIVLQDAIEKAPDHADKILSDSFYIKR